MDDGEAAAGIAAEGALGVPVVDCHCHWMPQPVTRAIFDWFDRHARDLWPIRYRMDESARLAHLRRLGVRAFTTLCYAHKPGMAADLNEWAAAFAARVPEAVPFGTFYPEEGVAAYVERGLAVHRFRGFKLHLQVGRFDLMDPRLEPAFRLVREADAVLVIHAGGAPLPAPYTGAEHFRRFLARWGDLRIVVAHMGASEYGTFFRMLADHPRLHLDTATTFVDFPAAIPYPSDVQARLPEVQDRILFGSDYPTIAYPYAAAVEGVRALGHGPAFERAVLRENAERLLGLT